MKVSNAMQEVWDMKQAASEKTKHLSGVAYFKFIHDEVRRMFPDMVYRPAGRAADHAGAGPAAMVAEDKAEYGTTRGKRE